MGSLKEMAELLRKGAKMRSEACPECGTPLFQMKNGDIICPMCQRPVKIVPRGADEDAAVQQGSLEQTMMRKINEVQGMLEQETRPEAIRELAETLVVLLDARERVRKLS